MKVEFREEFDKLNEEFYLAIPEVIQPDCAEEGIRKLFRIFHTIKSTGRAVGFEEVAELCHRIEDCLAVLRVHPEYNDQIFLDSLVESMREMRINLSDATAGYSLGPMVAKFRTELRRIQSSPRRADANIPLVWKNFPASLNSQPAQSEGGFEGIFEKAKIVAERTAAELGKSVNIYCFESDLRISTHVLEKLADPILQLVRNAIVHGIETRAERIERWKKETACVYLKVVAIENLIVVDVMDDGRGVDAAAVYARAKNIGITQETTSSPSFSDRDLLSVLCTPGFSTTVRANELSGRGVGLDVVNSAVKSLDGEFLLFNRQGRGAIFKIRIPYSFEKKIPKKVA